MSFDEQYTFKSLCFWHFPSPQHLRTALSICTIDLVSGLVIMPNKLGAFPDPEPIDEVGDPDCDETVLEVSHCVRWNR